MEEPKFLNIIRQMTEKVRGKTIVFDSLYFSHAAMMLGRKQGNRFVATMSGKEDIVAAPYFDFR